MSWSHSHCWRPSDSAMSHSATSSKWHRHCTHTYLTDPPSDLICWTTFWPEHWLGWAAFADLSHFICERHFCPSCCYEYGVLHRSHAGCDQLFVSLPSPQLMRPCLAAWWTHYWLAVLMQECLADDSERPLFSGRWTCGCLKALRQCSFQHRHLFGFLKQGHDWLVQKLSLTMEAHWKNYSLLQICDLI